MSGDSNQSKRAPSPYRQAAPVAHYFKAVIQMIAGSATILIATWRLFQNLALQHESAGMAGVHLFSIVGLGLGIGAAIELAYTLYTHGPDEALDPLMLALSAALLLQLGALKSFDLRQAAAAVLFVLALTTLLLARKHLVAGSDPDDWEPPEGRWQYLRRHITPWGRRRDTRQLGRASGSVAILPRLSHKGADQETAADRPD